MNHLFRMLSFSRDSPMLPLRPPHYLPLSASASPTPPGPPRTALSRPAQPSLGPEPRRLAPSRPALLSCERPGFAGRCRLASGWLARRPKSHEQFRPCARAPPCRSCRLARGCATAKWRQLVRGGARGVCVHRLNTARGGKYMEAAIYSAHLSIWGGISRPPHVSAWAFKLFLGEAAGRLELKRFTRNALYRFSCHVFKCGWLPAGGPSHCDWPADGQQQKKSTLARQVDLPGHAWPRAAEVGRPATADSTAGTRPRDAADGMRAWAVRECQLPRGGLQHPEAACRLEQDPGGRP